jgi:hypothetical protein
LDGDYFIMPVHTGETYVTLLWWARVPRRLSSVGLVRARTWLYDDRGRVVGETLWLSTDSTGEGAEVTGREPLPFDARAQVSQDASSAVVRFGVVQCL